MHRKGGCCMLLERITILEVLELRAFGYEINLNDGKISSIKERME